MCSKENEMNDEKYLSALRSYWKVHNTFPSMEFLCGVLGLRSKSGVFSVVGRLVSAGYLLRVDTRIAPTKKFFARPLLGHVRAGLPQPVTQEEPELITLDDYLIDDPDRTSFHRVKGDSMKDAGIFEGDLLAVEHNCPTKPGDVVVAYADGDLTVKTLRLDEQGKFYLEAANASFQPIRPKTSLEVLGVVVSVVRRVRR
jgi:repressor LexA